MLKLLFKFDCKMTQIIKKDIRLKACLVSDIWGQPFDKRSNLKLDILIYTDPHLQLFKLPYALFYIEILLVKRGDL